MKFVACLALFGSSRGVIEQPRNWAANLGKYTSSMDRCSTSADCSNDELCIYWTYDGDDRDFCAHADNLKSFGRLQHVKENGEIMGDSDEGFWAMPTEYPYDKNDETELIKWYD